MEFRLPMFSLVLWVALVVVPVTHVYANLVSEAHGAPTVTLRAGSTTLTSCCGVTSSSARTLRLRACGPRAIAGINLPASFIQLLLASLFHSWPGSWAPAGLDFRSWRAISFPIFCLPFWWFEGLGLDGLLKRKHLHWRTFLLGTLFWGLFLTGCSPYRRRCRRRERSTPSGILPMGIAGLSVFPIGWIIRWHSRRQCSLSR